MIGTTEIARIGILAYPGAQRAAVHGLSDLFETANSLAETHCRLDRRIAVEHYRQKDSQKNPPAALFALILPPSLSGPPVASHTLPIAAWLIAQHRRGTRVCSVCAGAFLLAESGLLDGRSATTHWALADDFALRFPQVRLDTAKLLIDDGDLLTAGGVMAWIDLGLRLIERWLGPAVMLATARMFLVDSAGREQRYYSSHVPRLDHGDEAILKVQAWLQQQCQGKLTLAAMARHAGLGGRTFLRRFLAATGRTPTAYVQQLRVTRARELLETTSQAIDRIAWNVGYGDASAFRKIFQRTIGLSPGAYRQRFSTGRVRMDPIRTRTHRNASA